MVSLVADEALVCADWLRYAGRLLKRSASINRPRRRPRRVPAKRHGPSRNCARYVIHNAHEYPSYNESASSLEMGTFVHAVEDEMLCQSVMPDKVPHFNAPIYLANKSQIGKVDEILGPINEVYFSIKMGEGMVANSFKKGDKVYISGEKLLPIDRFLPKPKAAGGEWSYCSWVNHVCSPVMLQASVRVLSAVFYPTY